MGIHAVAHGRVVGAPVSITVDGDSAAVLLLRDAGACDGPVEYEVFCREPDLRRLVRDQVRLGDAVVVIGELMLHRVLGPVEDEVSAARVILEAATVALQLESALSDSLG